MSACYHVTISYCQPVALFLDKHKKVTCFDSSAWPAYLPVNNGCNSISQVWDTGSRQMGRGTTNMPFADPTWAETTGQTKHSGAVGTIDE